jgi:hypothetical protein
MRRFGWRTRVEQLKQHNHVLQLKVDAMARKLFGKSSEKLDADQLQMVFDTLENEQPQEAKKPDASDLAECGSEAEAGTTTRPAQRMKKRKFEDIINGLPTPDWTTAMALLNRLRQLSRTSETDLFFSAQMWAFYALFITAADW